MLFAALAEGLRLMSDAGVSGFCQLFGKRGQFRDSRADSIDLSPAKGRRLRQRNPTMIGRDCR